MENFISNDDTRKMLSSLFEEFDKEKRKLKNQYDNNNEKLDEIEKNIENYLKYDDENKVFSPRNVTNKNDDIIVELRNQKQIISDENRALADKIHYYDEKIKQLSPALTLNNSSANTNNIVDSSVNEDISNSNIEDNNVVDINTDVISENVINQNISDSQITNTTIVNKENIIDQLQFVLSKIRLCSVIIDNDTIRSKMELKSVEEYLSDLINSL